MIRIKNLICGLIITFILLSGCGNRKELKIDSIKNNNLDSVELSVYVFGAQPIDTPLVLDELNNKTKKDLNCTVKIITIPWIDWSSKYNLLLASKEPIDLIYTSSWVGFSDYAQKGAYLPLNDLLLKYAPETYNSIPMEHWKQAKSNGKIYAIPNTSPSFDPWGIVIRKDLRIKYKLPEVKDIKGFEVYLDTVKKNEKDIMPLNLGTDDQAIVNLLYANSGWEELKEEKDLAIMANQSDVKNPFIVANTTEFLDFASMMKRWSEKGFWSLNVLSSKLSSSQNFKQGRSAAAIDHFMTVQNLVASGKDANPAYDIEFLPLSKITNIIHEDPVMQNAVAIPKSAPNPERALMLLEKLRNNKSYYHLTAYGIEGKHYVINSNGKRKLPEGVNDGTNGYPSEQFSWGWKNSRFELKPETERWDKFDEFYNEFKNIKTPDKLVGFQLEKESIRVELAAVSQVDMQYLPTIYFGIGDPVKNVEKYKNQLKAAGIDKLLEETERQLKSYSE